MGTNFYGRKQIQPALEIYAENKAHLGKASCGWKFLAQWNEGEYYTNEKEYFDFVESLEIFDEYGNFIKFQQFENIVSTQKGKTHGYNSWRCCICNELSRKRN